MGKRVYFILTNRSLNKQIKLYVPLVIERKKIFTPHKNINSFPKKIFFFLEKLKLFEKFKYIQKLTTRNYERASEINRVSNKSRSLERKGYTQA